MIKFKTPYEDLEPISKHTFRKHVLKSVLLQAFMAVSIFCIIKFLHFDLSKITTWAFLACLVLCSISCLVYIFEPTVYRQRFKDIYPDTNPGFTWLIASLFFPAFFFGFTLFLYFKDPERHIRTALSFKTVSLIFLPMICLQLCFPSMAYWLSSPSIYYVVETTHSTFNIIAYKQSLKGSDLVVENYLKQYGLPKKSTEKILLLAVAAAAIIKDKEQRAAGAKDPIVSFKYGERLVSSITDIYYSNSAEKFEFSSYGPIQWIHPGGAFEILLIEGIENGIMYQFYTTLSDKNLEMISKMEKNIGRLPASLQPEYKSKFQKHRQIIQSAEVYKEALAEKEEKRFSVK